MIGNVAEFHEKFGLPLGTDDQLMQDPAAQEFRVKFLQEELDELKEALASGDKVGAFDALLDLAYVAAGFSDGFFETGLQPWDVAAGALRGAGSIGATLLAPIDVASDALAGKGLTLESNRQRRADMDSALGTLGADTDSIAYKVGKVGGEIAGTAGAGGVVANALRLVGAPAALVSSIASGGMSAQGVGMLLRIAGGAITDRKSVV